MPEITLTKIAVGHDVPIPACVRVSDLGHSIERRAFEIFLERGGGHGNHLEDWNQAEREMMGHALVNLYEDEGGYRADFQVPGFEPAEIQVAISPQVVGLHALHRAPSNPTQGEVEILHEFSQGEAYRQITFPVEINPETAEVGFEDGVLHITVKKAQSTTAPEENPMTKGASA